MRPRRITATGKFWEQQLPLAKDQDRAETSRSFAAKALPPHTDVPLDTYDASKAEQMSVWLRKHGRVLKPKLSAEQGRQLQQCFRLMDADGSGAIGPDELSSAFELLGIKATNATIQKMIADAGANESGEVGYNDFVAMMAPILSCKIAEPSSRGKAAQTVVKSGSAVSFDTSINEYRRKKIIQALHERDTEVLGMLSTAQGSTTQAVQATSALSAPAMPTHVQSTSAHPATSGSVHGAALQGHNAFPYGGNRTASSPVKRHHTTSAAHQTLADNRSFHVHHGTAAAALRVGRQKNAHLAALKALGELESVLQDAAGAHEKRPAQRRHQQELSTSNAQQTAAQQNSKGVRDMFGVVTDNTNSTAAELGLVLMRPASSLW
ncbi:hypothetical protein ABBQ38_009861 [Trebouxia sp. C0009 RCD-2024]